MASADHPTINNGSLFRPCAYSQDALQSLAIGLVETWVKRMMELVESAVHTHVPVWAIVDAVVFSMSTASPISMLSPPGNRLPNAALDLE